MVYFVYILRSTSTLKYYKGLTFDINRRLIEHNSGKCSATRNGKPWDLIYVHLCQCLNEAREWEIFFKSGIGREVIKEISNI